ncbi:MAG: cardiolipin synthase [Planctomycetes bacterium]|nr:cardiolipin synthase [Planctomycetota bacterium]
MAVIVLLRKGDRPPVAMAWMVVVLALPVVGLVAYLLVGETRFGVFRMKRHARIIAEVDCPANHEQADPRIRRFELAPEQHQIASVAALASHSIPLAGNRLWLSGDTQETIDRMCADIDQAAKHVHLLTYICLPDKAGQQVCDALLRAAARGVACRLLLDGVGSKEFLRDTLRAALVQGGVQVVEALPVNMLRMVFARLDMRNHRKLLVVDGTIGWAGSQNIAEAGFAPKAKYAPWVDCSVRVEGPLVKELQMVFIEDWYMESEEDLDEILRIEPEFREDGVIAQSFASGPNFQNDSVTQLIQSAVQIAKEELVLTTPYFVPDYATLSALEVAARRGVRVHLVVPARNDSMFVRLASRSLYRGMLECGVRIHEFQKGLLHAKTVVIDRATSIVTSANLDRRSFEINFEVGILVFDKEFSGQLRYLQNQYMEQSSEVLMTKWDTRKWWDRLIDNAGGLLSPLL